MTKLMPRGKPFQKGVSGNPGGRPKIPDEERSAREILEGGAPAAAQVLVDIVEGKRRCSMIMIGAARDVLDRVLGKPVQAVVADVNQRHGFVVAPAKASREEWLAEVEAMQRGEPSRFVSNAQGRTIEVIEHQE